MIALVLKKLRHGKPVGLYQPGAKATEYAALQPGAPVVAAGHDAITGRGANRGTGMHIGKDHAFGGKRIDIWGSDLPLWVQALHIAITKIIAQHIDDVGCAVWRGANLGETCKETETRQQ